MPYIALQKGAYDREAYVTPKTPEGSLLSRGGGVYYILQSGGFKLATNGCKI